jgi:pimeloyl-ACP methyl ester carboxylesterase/DNA-binding CsgD family transcriptional regulator
MRQVRQSIRFLKAPDGVTIAWADAGEGPALVKVANWLSHLEYDWDSPCWRHWMQFFAENFRFIRYDERGCGMTDWDVEDLSPARWIQDLESVVAKARPQEPFILLGISQGTAAAVQFAALYPDKISHLILYGGYAEGWKFRENAAGRRAYEATVELARFGWGADNPVFRQLFTSRFIPEATEEQIGWFNELCRRTTRPEIAARLLQARSEVNVTEYLPRVRTRTLVIHAGDDEVVPLSAGRRLASEIPNAEFVQLESRNHILLECEPAWERFREIVLQFTGRPRDDATAEDPVFQELSDRERQILTRMCSGASNAEIGRALFISDKTVRNHVTRIFEKLGVGSRAQAIVMAHEKGFRGDD